MSVIATVSPRWLRLDTYPKRWKHRSKVAARIIRKHRWVCDIGSGREHLSDYLPVDAVYLPADVSVWHEGVEVCDLNAGILPERSLAKCDIAVMLGVLQVIRDPQALFHQLSERVEYLLISHHSLDRNPRRIHWQIPALTEVQMTAFLDNAGFEIISRKPFKSQTLYYARNTGFSQIETRSKARTAHPMREQSAVRRWLGKMWAI